MINAYTLWKTAHIISAAILFGTGLGIAFFAWFGYQRALRSNSLDAMRTVLQLTVIGDAVFTTPAVIFQVLSGFILLRLDSWSVLSVWSVTVLSLFIIIGLLWLPVVVIQIAMSREASRAGSIKDLSVRFHRRFLLWFSLGVPAFIAVIVMFLLMVTKPLPVI